MTIGLVSGVGSDIAASGETDGHGYAHREDSERNGDAGIYATAIALACHEYFGGIGLRTQRFAAGSSAGQDGSAENKFGEPFEGA